MSTTVSAAHDEKAYQLMEQLSLALWYERAGEVNDQTEERLKQFFSELQVENVDIEWATKEETAQLITEFTFENSAVWDKLKDLPDQLKEKIEKNNKQEQMEDIIDRAPELIYLRTFDRAYELFQDEKLIKYLVVHAMYVSVLACVAALAEDDLFNPIVEMIEEGHIPLGIKENTVYLL